jgi:hypothetical protein
MLARTNPQVANDTMGATADIQANTVPVVVS